MGQSLKTFLMIALAASFLTACEPGEPETEGQVGVVVPKTAKAKLTSERATIISLLGDADGIFRQVWPHLKQAGTAVPPNVFQVLKQYLQTNFTETGVVRTHADSFCQDGRAVVDSKEVKKSATVLSHLHTLNFQDCSGANSVRLAQWWQLADGSWIMQFQPENLSNGLGQYMSMMVKTSYCSFKGNEANRLMQMKCHNIGQDIDGAKYVHISKLLFDLSAAKPLQIDGWIREPLAEAPAPTETKLEIEDQARENILKIVVKPLANPNQKPPVPGLTEVISARAATPVPQPNGSHNPSVPPAGMPAPQPDGSSNQANPEAAPFPEQAPDAQQNPDSQQGPLPREAGHPKPADLPAGPVAPPRSGSIPNALQVAPGTDLNDNESFPVETSPQGAPESENADTPLPQAVT